MPAPDAAARVSGAPRKDAKKPGVKFASDDLEDYDGLFRTVLMKHVGLTAAQAAAMSRLEVQYFVFRQGELLVDAGTR